jgi:HAD superfamily hydrolase (TIGR01509 family)
MISPHNIDAIFFDLDGTLVDTDDAAVDKLAHRLRPIRRLLPGRDPLRLARWLAMQAETPGNALMTVLDTLHLDEPMAAVGDRLRAWRGLKHPADFHPIDGVEAMLAELAGRYTLALVTNRGRRHIHAFCQSHPTISQHLTVCLGRQDTKRMKPHPAPLQLAANRLNVPIECCLMVGDTPVDVKAARRAGAWSAAVLCGFGQRDELEQAGAHVILEYTAELADFL